MTTLIISGETTTAPAFIRARETDTPVVVHLARLLPEQIVGAYSLVARRGREAEPPAFKSYPRRRAYLGHTGFGLFYPK